MRRPELRKTKIECTIGPAGRSPEFILELAGIGMHVARLNFSHGDREEHAQTIRLIRNISKNLGREVGILQDLGGPKTRLGQLALAWGVIPDWVESFTHTDQMFHAARRWALDRGLASLGDRLVISAGVPSGMSGTTNLLKVMELSSASELMI